MRLPQTILLALVGVAVVLTSCDALVDRPGLQTNFGSPYTVLFGASVTGSSGLMRATPFVDGARSLHVAVQFSGGCENHVFRPEYILLDTSARIWLVHADNGDPCEAAVQEQVVVALPEAVLEKEDLFLAAPDGREEPIARFDPESFPGGL